MKRNIISMEKFDAGDVANIIYKDNYNIGWDRMRIF
jgi:hypothetical protein